MEYGLTWNRQATPSGLRFFLLRASGRRTSDTESSGGLFGYPTPNAQDFGAVDLERATERRAECKGRTGNGNGFGLTLQQAIPLWFVGYPTPRSTDGDKGIRSPEGAETEWRRKGEGADLATIAQLAGWGTPAVSDSRDVEYSYGNRGDGKTYTIALRLPGQACLTGETGSKQMEALAGWATPTVRDDKDASCLDADVPTNGLLGRQAVRLPPQEGAGTTSPSSPAATAGRVVSRLRPGFSLWLMGYPVIWSLCSPGWEDWDTIERLLADFYAGPAPTGEDD